MKDIVYTCFQKQPFYRHTKKTHVTTNWSETLPVQ